jgi:hypothetical protein
MSKLRILKVVGLIALVVALVVVATPAPVVKAAPSSCPSTISYFFLGGGMYGAQWASNSYLTGTSSGGQRCHYYGTITTWTTSSQSSTSGSWSRYLWQLP